MSDKTVDVAVRERGRKVETANGQIEDVVPYLVKKYDLEDEIDEITDTIQRMIDGR